MHISRTGLLSIKISEEATSISCWNEFQRLKVGLGEELASLSIQLLVCKVLFPRNHCTRCLCWAKTLLLSYAEQSRDFSGVPLPVVFPLVDGTPSGWTAALQYESRRLPQPLYCTVFTYSPSPSPASLNHLYSSVLLKIFSKRMAAL